MSFKYEDDVKVSVDMDGELLFQDTATDCPQKFLDRVLPAYITLDMVLNAFSEQEILERLDKDTVLAYARDNCTGLARFLKGEEGT